MSRFVKLKIQTLSAFKKDQDISFYKSIVLFLSVSLFSLILIFKIDFVFQYLWRRCREFMPVNNRVCSLTFNLISMRLFANFFF